MRSRLCSRLDFFQHLSKKPWVVAASLEFPPICPANKWSTMFTISTQHHNPNNVNQARSTKLMLGFEFLANLNGLNGFRSDQNAQLLIEPCTHRFVSHITVKWEDRKSHGEMIWDSPKGSRWCSFFRWCSMIPTSIRRSWIPSGKLVRSYWTWPSRNLVSFPIYSNMVDLSVVFCKRSPENGHWNSDFPHDKLLDLSIANSQFTAIEIVNFPIEHGGSFQFVIGKRLPEA